MKIFFRALLFLLITQTSHSQLGFCTGSTGAAIFTENFGNGTTYGPPLPAGFTNYPFVAGTPNDGFYTLSNNTNLYSTWHNSLDHTPDASNGPNGKALIVNANAATSGDFYKRTVSGLCTNTTFEFSAWLMNVYNAGIGFCGAGQIPINVRFEIWNDAETILLGSGNTGNIFGSVSPNWQQFALVFTTTSQTAVVLKMKNNGTGGCGNDLAIDDIEFKACGQSTTITSPGVVGSNLATCQNPISIQLEDTAASAGSNVYQWQSSTDNVNWIDIPSANSSTYTTPSLTAPIFYRTRIAQDIANINNSFCSTISEVFSISFLGGTSNAGTLSGTQNICVGLSAIFTSTTLGGTWTSSNSAVATINPSSGLVTGIAVGTATMSYTVPGSGGCANVIATRTVTVTAAPIAGTLSGTQNICQGLTSTFSSTTLGGTWSSSDTAVATINPSSGIVSGLAAGTATMTYTVLGSGGCANATVDQQITITPTPQLTNSGINIICSNETSNVLLTATVSGTNFAWTVSQSGVTGATSGSGNSINQTLTSTNGGNAIYTVTPEFNGCSGNQLSINIVVNENPMVDLLDGAICFSNSSNTSGVPFLLDTKLGATENSFQWFFEDNPIINATGNTYQANQVGQYAVIATNTLTGCASALSSAIVSEIEKGESLIIQQSEPFIFDQTIVVTVVGGTGPFLYQLDDGNFQNSNTFNNVLEGEHIISVIDEENCTDLKASVTILNYPGFFTPNNDGYNDTWNIVGLNSDAKISIFDRYGKLIKQISTNGSGWDGTYNGQVLFGTDYWFTLTYRFAGIEKTFKGHFSLKK